MLFCHISSHLKQEGGLANTRITSQKDHRSRDESAAEHSVEFDNTGGVMVNIRGFDLRKRYRFRSFQLVFAGFSPRPDLHQPLAG